MEALRTRVWKSTGIKTVLVLSILVLLVLGACQTTNQPPPYVTWTPSPSVTPSPTLRICPPNQKIASANDLKLHTTFIVILFDQASVNSSTMAYMNGQTTGDAFAFIKKVLPELLGPGDQYSIFRLGYRSYEAARVDRYSSKIIDAPQIGATPAPYATLPSITPPVIYVDEAVLQKIKDENTYKTAVAEQQATATQQDFEYNCNITAFDNIFAATATMWSVTQTAVATEISSKLDGISTPSSSALEPPFADTVYEGLSEATIDIETQCSRYEKCVLLIIDDLYDWRNTTPDHKVPDLYINLKNVEIVSIMPNCTDIYQPSCKNIQ
ncbi:MAG: hypothetical protein HYR93_02150, partial [Chloroflexi bacterium]|nr:hypothetical protein [Chloroflexota bacterium]